MTAPPRLDPNERTRPRPADADDVIVAIDADGMRRQIGKLDAHLHNIRHMAVSIFVFRDGKLLLQKRAAGKYHSPHLWANTCCSHPRWDESADDCALRRLREELGFSVVLQPFGIVEYQAPVGDLYENEIVHRFHGRLPADGPPVVPDPEEVEEIAWMSLYEIETDIAARPDAYAPWFRIYMREHRGELDDLAGAT